MLEICVLEIYRPLRLITKLPKKKSERGGSTVPPEGLGHHRAPISPLGHIHSFGSAIAKPGLR
jgi:hypothetical protein